ncbi:Nucleolar complex protein 2 like [Apostasia shenzhenica]|uniref:Nucleolar complex protein 2 like n=1 Tax=Apostasia shenzhenica TaxID=1088818 RepID=A0A2H9ZWH3_9ASPA|nr:Nucleolar complex protein 2 like [Apostasia shenzhenica]
MSDVEDSDKSNTTAGKNLSKSRRKAVEHVKQLLRLQEKDPEFYDYLKEHDKELLEFNDEDVNDDNGADFENVKSKPTTQKLQEPSRKKITTTKVDSWCTAIKTKRSVGSIRSVLRAYRAACHHGDDAEEGSGQKFAILSSSVFNKIMVFVLNEMDGILRELLEAPGTGGKKETIMDLMTTNVWKAHGSLMRLYLGNTLHILIEMTDEQMISFTLKRIKASAVFLAAFPSLLRKYIRVVLHTWATGRGALPVVSFLFLRDLCVRLGPDCLDSCLRGLYKAYVMNCKLPKYITKSKLQYINFLGNCVSELYGLDPITAYQHAFISIRELAIILHGALTERGPKAVKDKKKEKNYQESNKSSKKQVEKTYQKVYNWQFLFCLELWTKVISTYNSGADFGPLAYPLSQILSGVANLVPTARYFPLRLRCIKMLNHLAGATDAFIPLSTLLLDMLDMKELNRPPTGVGKGVDMLGVKQLDKATLKTRAFQEECIYSVVEELAVHLAQWSCSLAFFELSFIPLVRLRRFCKTTKADRFRREVKELVCQLEANCEYANSKRAGINFSPNDPEATSFVEAEEFKSTPLMQYVTILHQRAQQRASSMVESSIFVGAESSVFGSKFSVNNDEEIEGNEEEGATVFSSSWMPEKKPKVTKLQLKSSKKQDSKLKFDLAVDEDVVEDLVLSSDEDDLDEDDGDDDAYGHSNQMASNDSPDEFKDNEPNHNEVKQVKKRKRWQKRKRDNEKDKPNTNLKRKGRRHFNMAAKRNS